MRTTLLLFCAAITFAARAASIQELMDASDHAAVVRAFAQMQTPTPEERALYADALARLYRTTEARQVAEALMRDAPANPWSWFARAAAADDIEHALPATQKMMELAGANPDDRLIRSRMDHLVWVSRYAEVYALIDARPPSLDLKIARAQTLLTDASEHDRPEDKTKAAELLQALADENPQSVSAQSMAAWGFMALKRSDDAYPYAKRAAALTPSIAIHARYWEGIATAAALSPEQRRAEFEKDLAELMQSRGDWPELWVRVARAYEKQFDAADLAEEWRARVIRDAPASSEAATVLYERYLKFAEQNRDVSSNPELQAKMIQLLREAIAHPQLADGFRNSASLRLLTVLDDDPRTTDEEILAVMDAAPGLEAEFGSALRISLLLSDRRLRLDRAQALARTAIEKGNLTIETSMAGNEAGANRMRAMGRDALGWALLQSGDLASARTQLLAAKEHDAKVPVIQYHLGQWYEAAGKPDLAEKAYQLGMTLQSRTKNPNEAALAALYQTRHGAQATEYAKKSVAKGVQTRRNQILATRDAKPAAAPLLPVEHIDGKPVSAASLKGKVVVVNFWGIWCGYCIEELPEYQQLARKYANDPRVVVLTINNDGNAEKVRKWMRSKQFDFTVLNDGGFAERQRVKAWPTTWFIDPQGRIAFKKEGWTEHLLEEFGWRIDALTAR
jgi:thiol-disulfide isomerase/thioredoxin